MNRRARQRRAAAGGFTFVEILAALMFLAVVVPTIVTALTLSNKAGELTERGEAAGQLAENKLNELLVGDAYQSAAASSGDCGPDWPGYRWVLTQNPWSGGGNAGGASVAVGGSSTGSSGNSSVTGAGSTNASGGLTELKVEVFFKIQGSERGVALSTLVNTLTTSTSTTTTTSTTGKAGDQ